MPWRFQCTSVNFKYLLCTTKKTIYVLQKCIYNKLPNPAITEIDMTWFNEKCQNQKSPIDI